MDNTALLSCRGCLTKVSNKSQHSFVQPAIKELFMECTAIRLPPDDCNLPQQICTECLSKCEQWYIFKKMCHGANEYLTKSNSKPEIIEDDEEMNMARGQFPLDGNDGEDEIALGELVVDSEEEDIEDITIDDVSDQPTPDNSTDFDCPVCKAVLPESVHLRDHLKEHYSDKEPKCPICAETFTRGSKVYAHVIAVHMEGKTETVPVCPKEKAKTKHSSGKEAGTMYSCPICKEQCLELRNHIMDSHVPSGTLTCPICSRPFGQRRDLSRHLFVHTKEKPFGCNKCHVKFTQEDSLKIHQLKKHRQGRNSKAISGSLRVHKCPLCDSIDTLGKMRIHFVMHTNERPYQCIHCNKDFTHKNNGTRHVRKVHASEPTETSIVLKEDSIFHNVNPWEEMGYSLDDNGGPDANSKAD